MLDWFNALFSIFADFIRMLFELPFFGAISFGYLLVAIILFGMIFKLFIEDIK